MWPGITESLLGLEIGNLVELCLALLRRQRPRDAVNRPEFPSVLHDPERPYRQRLSLTVA